MKHLWMECPSCGLKYRNEVYDELVAALRMFVDAYEPEYISAMAEDSERSGLDEAMDAACAALAKVTK